MRRSVSLIAMVYVALSLTQVAVANEDEAWKSSLALGLNLTDGNSETTQVNAEINADKKWDINELALGARAAYAETDSDTTTDNGSIFGQYNRLFSDQLYGYVNSSLSYDDVADVDYRFMVGPGVGYYFIKTEPVQLSVEAGLTYIEDEVGGEEDDTIAIRLAQRYDRVLSETAKVWQSIEFLPEADDFDNYLMNFEAGVETALGAKTNLRVSLLNRYDSEALPDREKNDLAVNVALVYAFQ